MDKRLSIKNLNAINKILQIVREGSFTPQQVRYLFKKVREEGKYQVKNTTKTLPEFLNDAEIYTITNKSIEYGKNPMMLINLAIFTGLRVAEMSNLMIEHIDFNNHQLKVVQGKGGKDRMIPLTNNLLIHLKSHITDRKKGYVLCKGNETKYTTRALELMVEKIVDKCGFTKHIHTHTLRHTFATLLLRKGIPLERIQLLLGHSKITTTQIYAHMELAPVKEQFIQLIGME